MEIRFIVWECEGIPNLDYESSDIFFNATIGQESQATDVHFNCWKGTGSFNWRIVITAEYNEEKDKDIFVNLQAYDYDIFSKNDFIAQKSLSIAKVMKECDKYDIPIKFDKNYFENCYGKSISLNNIIDKENSILENENSLKNIFDWIEFEENEKFWIKLDKGMNTKIKVIKHLLFVF
jgi:hypothetical protein